MICLVAFDIQTGRTIGGALILREAGRVGRIRTQAARGSDAVRAQAIQRKMAKLVVGWIRTEMDLMVLEYIVPEKYTGRMPVPVGTRWPCGSLVVNL